MGLYLGLLMFQGGLTTTSEGLGYSCVPCAGPLSVAGFSAFLRLFPLGTEVIPGCKSLLITLGFEQELSLISHYSLIP